MSEQTVAAESSPAPAAPVMDVARGPMVDWTSEQRIEFRKTGNTPDMPKHVEEAAPSGTVEAPDSDKAEGATETPEKPQEHIDKGGRRRPDAEQRISQLTGDNKRLKAELEALKTPKPQPEPQPRPAPVQQQPQAQFTRAKPTAEDTKPDGSPKYSTYEDFVEELADWKAEQRWAASQREAAAQAQNREMKAKVDEARGRYENFDEVLQPTLHAIVGDQEISPSIKAMLNDSEVLPDLIFTIGSDKEELSRFLAMAKSSPGKAIRYIALTESLINEELAGKGKTEAKPEPPVKPQTMAPRPPSEVGGRAATPGDELESAAKANDFRRFKAESLRRDLAKLKG